MKNMLVTLSLLAVHTCICAQAISLQKGWKFRIGDDPGWSAPTLDQTDWQEIDVSRPWERQGYPTYDGFAWYRLQTTLPSSLRKNSFFKDSIRIYLGDIDDGGEVYINGKLVYKNWTTGDIRQGLYGPGNITIAASDPVLLWDQPNTIAVRIFDSGGDGGIYGHDLSLRMASPLDNLLIDTDEPFLLKSGDSLSKKIVLRTSDGAYKFTGRLQINLTDPETGTVILTKTEPVVFAINHPFDHNAEFQNARKKIIHHSIHLHGYPLRSVFDGKQWHPIYPHPPGVAKTEDQFPRGLWRPAR